jgi:hypothetical protein
MTEITEELNGIEPNNHYELIIQGKINKANNNIIIEKEPNGKASMAKNIINLNPIHCKLNIIFNKKYIS